MVTLLSDETIRSQQDGAEMSNVGRGRLYLTNKRVIFDKMSGFLFKRTTTALAVSLSDITKVEVQGNNIIIDTATSKHVISSKNPVDFASLIEAAIKDLSKQAAPTTGQPSVVPKAPPPPLTAFCPFCGAKLPSSAFYCDHCGKRVK